MNTYVYRAALHCEDCGEEIKSQLGYTWEGRPEEDFDSDEYPKGPYPRWMNEADYPAHCDTCGVFLENPLTSDGIEYVKEALSGPTGSPEVLALWAEFYSDLLGDYPAGG